MQQHKIYSILFINFYFIHFRIFVFDRETFRKLKKMWRNREKMIQKEVQTVKDKNQYWLKTLRLAYKSKNIKTRWNIAKTRIFFPIFSIQRILNVPSFMRVIKNQQDNWLNIHQIVSFILRKQKKLNFLSLFLCKFPIFFLATFHHIWLNFDIFGIFLCEKKRRKNLCADDLLVPLPLFVIYLLYATPSFFLSFLSLSVFAWLFVINERIVLFNIALNYDVFA